MKNFEALEILRNMVCTEDYLKEMQKISCDALEKQVPKKPIDKERCRYCPSCGEDEFYLMYDNMKDEGNRYNYCCNCGQKLDWSDYD